MSLLSQVKFMKEVKSRDPARRMVLRYDKLYVGNDVFFFNDRTGINFNGDCSEKLDRFLNYFCVK
jgi:hypothetical protein